MIIYHIITVFKMIYINYNWKHIDNTYKMTCILIYISIFYILYTRNELHEDGAD